MGSFGGRGAIAPWRGGDRCDRHRPVGTGEYATAQTELLWTFAEQAVIAITSAETYRALQTRTADLQELLEYQTASGELPEGHQPVGLRLATGA